MQTKKTEAPLTAAYLNGEFANTGLSVLEENEWKG
jgi:hypothetical protein